MSESVPLPRPGSLGLIQYAGVDMIEYAAAVSAAARDCRTCRNTITQYGVTRCNSTVVCTDADHYETLPPVRLWRTT